MKKIEIDKKSNVFSLVLCAIFVACALITNQIKIHMAFGGSITLLSMLFVVLCGYFCGLRYGIVSGIVFGLLNAVVGGISSIHWASLFLDYIFAYGAMGLGALTRNAKNGLYISYTIGVLGRFFFSWLSGWILFGAYAPEGQAPWLYSLLYQLSYMGPEYVITIAVLLIPAVRKMLEKLKSQM